MPEVPVTRVSFSGRADFARRMVAALQAAGATPIGAQILTAHVALSTGWGKAVDNYRIAGIKADASWRATKPYTVVRGCECKPGLPDQNDPKCVCQSGYGQQYSTMYWRAYDSLADAARDFLSLLSSSRYASALAMAQSGDTGYYAAVGNAGWYTADPSVVSRSCISNLEEIQGYLGGVASSGSVANIAVLAAGAYLIYRLVA